MFSPIQLTERRNNPKKKVTCHLAGSASGKYQKETDKEQEDRVGEGERRSSMELLGVAYRANDRRGSKIVVADEGGTSQPPEEQRLVSHDLSVRWLVRRQLRLRLYTPEEEWRR